MKRTSPFMPTPRRLVIPAHLTERRPCAGCGVVIVSAMLWALIAFAFYRITNQ